MTKLALSVSAVLLFLALTASKPLAQTPDTDRTVTEAQYEQWKTELSNWGRWGEDDEIGTLNLITPAKLLQAVALVEEGITVSLARDGDTVEAVDNPYPYEHTMLGISSDRIAVRYHGISHTHLDSLAHINANGVFYNGYTPDAEAVAAADPGFPPGKGPGLRSEAARRPGRPPETDPDPDGPPQPIRPHPPGCGSTA